jgi:hypothetical protein
MEGSKTWQIIVIVLGVVAIGFIVYQFATGGFS